MKKFIIINIFLIINLIASIVIPILITFGPVEVSKTNAVIIGFLIFLVLTCAQVLYFVQELIKRRKKKEEVWQAKKKFQRVLKLIADDFSIVVRDRRSDYDRLFEDLIMEEIIRLQDDVSDAASKKEVSVKGHHFKSHKNLEEIFKDSKVNIYSEVYLIEPSSQEFDYIYANFFKMVAKLVEKEEIKVRTLFVLKDKKGLDDIDIQNLVRFYHHTKDFDKKIIGVQHFDNLKKEYKVDGDWIDFGIYGDQVIFNTYNYSDNFSGIFSKDGNYIQQFTDFFDKAWEDSSDLPLIQEQDKSISLNELFKRFQ